MTVDFLFGAMLMTAGTRSQISIPYMYIDTENTKKIPVIPKHARNAINAELNYANETDSSFDIPVLENKSDESETLLAKFILNLRASTNISNAKLQEVLCQMQELIENSVRCTLDKVNNILKTENSQVQLPSLVNFEEVIQNSVASFKNLNTIYKQDNYFSKQFHVTAPKTIDLSRDIISNSRDVQNNRQYEIKDKIMVYIPLKGIILNLITNKYVKEMMAASQYPNINNTLKSFNDGSLFKHCDFFLQKPDALQFILYYDELEVCNPLGSKAGLQKLGMFYIVLGNIPPKYRSCLKMINLLAIVRASYVKTYGMDKILEPIVEDLKDFENGVHANGEIKFGN